MLNYFLYKLDLNMSRKLKRTFSFTRNPAKNLVQTTLTYLTMHILLLIVSFFLISVHHQSCLR